MGRANITLICDNEMEGIEFFNITLTSNNPLVAIGENISTVQMIDNTGKHMCIS